MYTCRFFIDAFHVRVMQSVTGLVTAATEYVIAGCNLYAPLRHMCWLRFTLAFAISQICTSTPIHSDLDLVHPYHLAPPMQSNFLRTIRALRVKSLRPYSTPAPTPLKDSFARPHTYLRISLTERCNLRCQYCMPSEGVTLPPADSLLTTHEILRLATLFTRRGVNKIRLTGGEPLVRRDIIPLTQSLAALPGLDSLAMTTNGLALKRKLPALQNAGLSALNISLDTLVPAKFEFITRRKGQQAVMEAISRAIELNFASLKVNVVVMKGFNDDELADFVRLTKDANIDVRFIEYMPFDGNRWSDAKFLSYADMLDDLSRSFGVLNRVSDTPNDTCKHYRVPGFVGRVGFITSMSNHFCGTCNRLRITADGNLKVCLFGSDELSLRDAMRNGMSDEQLNEIIDAALWKKHFSLGGNRDMYAISKQENRSMVRIGG